MAGGRTNGFMSTSYSTENIGLVSLFNDISNFVGYLYIFTNPSGRAGYDTRSIFKRSLTGLNLEFSFS